MTLRILVLGGPGSGKTSLSARIVREFGVERMQARHCMLLPMSEQPTLYQQLLAAATYFTRCPTTIHRSANASSRILTRAKPFRIPYSCRCF